MVSFPRRTRSVAPGTTTVTSTGKRERLRFGFDEMARRIPLVLRVRRRKDRDAHTKSASVMRRLGSRELSELLQAFWTVLLEELGQRSEVAKRVNPRVVTVAPREAERIVPYLFNRREIEVASGLKLDGSGVPLAARTRAESPQDFMWIA